MCNEMRTACVIVHKELFTVIIIITIIIFMSAAGQ